MKDNLLIIIFMDLGFINGMMEKFIKVIGKIIKWMVKGKRYGRMVKNIVESLKMI